MNWTFLDSWIVATAILTGASCALLGNFLVLRRMSMMGDAISHAVLPGLAIAFLITGSRGSIAMLVGAAIVGVLTALFTEWISRFGKVEEGAAMGVVFTGLFAAGLILIVRAADAVDLDPGCVLYGAIELTPLDILTIAGLEIPRAALINGAILLFNALVVGLLFKEFKIAAFDPALATAQGMNARFLHYLLMVLVAVTTVAAFESVGSILVIAMLIVPAATAQLLTSRLRPMILVSIAIAIACSALGHIAAITVPRIWNYDDTSTSGSIAVILGLIFLVALVFAPRQGLLAKRLHQLALSIQIAREDTLGQLCRLGPDARTAAQPADELAARLVATGPLARRIAWRQLHRDGKIILHDRTLRLTDAGLRDAQNLIRSHRLWENYLHEQIGLPPDHVHGTSEKLEHITTPEMQDQLAANARDTLHDPHGRPIPPKT